MIVLSHQVDGEPRVLIVENNRQHVGWFKDVCKKIGFLVHNIREWNDVTTAEQEAGKFGADVVILDLAVESHDNPDRGIAALDKWRGDIAVIVVSHFSHRVVENRKAYVVLPKPSNNKQDQIRFKEQLSMAIRSALALKSTNQGLRGRLTEKLSKASRTSKPTGDWDFKIVIPVLPGISITRRISFLTALGIFVVATAITAFFFIFRRG